MVKKVFFMIAATAILLASCSQAAVQGVPRDPVAAAGETEAKASFTLRMPTVAPFIVRDKGKKGSKALGSRLFMGATNVRFTIYDTWDQSWGEYRNMRGSWSASSAIEPSHEAMSTITLSITMPTGTFHPVFEVFNSNVSADTPVASYGSGSSTITVSLAGGNNFSFTLSPRTVTALPCDPEAIGTYPEYPAPPEAPYSLNLHGEAWFSFTSRSEENYITCTSYAGDADIYVFDASTYDLVAHSAVLGLGAETALLDRDTDDLPDTDNTPKDYIIGVWAYGEDTEFTLQIAEETVEGGEVTVE